MFISMARLRTAPPIQAEPHLYGDDLRFTHNLALEGVPMKLVGRQALAILPQPMRASLIFFAQFVRPESVLRA